MLKRLCVILFLFTLINFESGNAEESWIPFAVVIKCPTATGTGFYISPNVVSTAAHVVEKCLNPQIFNYKNESTTSIVYYRDKEKDIAFLKSKTQIALQVPLDNKQVTPGYTVFIVGSPIEGLVMSQGTVVNSEEYSSGGQIILKLPADHGNSGGPAFTKDGLVGMVTAKFDDGRVLAYDLNSIIAAEKFAVANKENIDPLGPSKKSSYLIPPEVLLYGLISGILVVLMLVLILRIKHLIRRNKRIVISVD